MEDCISAFVPCAAIFVNAAHGVQNRKLSICANAVQCLQSGDSEKDKLRASLGSAILAERPNVKVDALQSQRL